MAKPGEAELDAPSLALDVARERYPFCLVWTPIPCLTFLFPFVGHLGMATSEGVVWDFAGPYTVGEDDLAFGRATRYVQLFSADEVRRPELVEAWDAAVQEASEVYRGRMHNLFWDNCHSHVAFALNRIRYRGFARWNMVFLAVWLFFAGRFVSLPRMLWTLLPSVVLYSLIAVAVTVQHR